jgi:hypothetical protein
VCVCVCVSDSMFPEAVSDDDLLYLMCKLFEYRFWFQTLKFSYRLFSSACIIESFRHCDYNFYS